MKYRAKPVEIEAYEWTGDFAGDFPAEWRALDLLVVDEDGELSVRTNRGPAPVHIGDFVIRGTTREMWPIDAPSFHFKYQAVT